MGATTTAAVAAPASVRREGLAWAFAGVLLFSFSVPLTKEAVGGFSPFFTATGRAVIAGVWPRGCSGAARTAPAAPRCARSVHDGGGSVRLADPSGARAGADDLGARRRDRRVHAAHDRAHRRPSHPRARHLAVLGGGRHGHGGADRVRALARRGSGGDLAPTGLVVGAVLASSWCYVEGASVTRAMPGWQVISWVVVLALPVTIPATALLWWSRRRP